MLGAGARPASSVPQGGDRVAQEAGRDCSPALIGGLMGLETAADHSESVHVRLEEAQV